MLDNIIIAIYVLIGWFALATLVGMILGNALKQARQRQELD